MGGAAALDRAPQVVHGDVRLLGRRAQAADLLLGHAAGDQRADQAILESQSRHGVVVEQRRAHASPDGVHVLQLAPAGEGQQHVHVVQHQVLHDVSVGDAPIERAQPLQLQRHHALALQQLGHLAHGGIEVLDVPNLHDRAPGASGDRLAQGLRLLDVQRHGLLDQHVRPRAHRQQRVLHVQRARRADRHRPHLRQQLLRARERARVELVRERLAALGVEVVDPAQLAHAAQRAIGADVVRAHIARAEHPDGDRIAAAPPAAAAVTWHRCGGERHQLMLT